MKCLSCGILFSPSDILVMEDWELPVCDSCDAKGQLFQVDYNGTHDFEEFLAKKVEEKTCRNCAREKYELLSMMFGNPVKAEVICWGCKVDERMTIYIRYV